VRTITVLLLLSMWAAAQSGPNNTSPAPEQPAAQQDAKTDAAQPTAKQEDKADDGWHGSRREAKKDELVIPAGTKIPLRLQHALSTKNSRVGDGVYAQTTFPFAMNDRIVVPAGTYVQGTITHIQRAGHVKGRAEVLIHFTTLVYPSGYTVMLPGAVESAPGNEKATVKDKEGTIQGDGDTGRKVGTAVGTAGTGAVIGAISGGGKGALIGGGIGGAAGAAIAMLSRGNEVVMPAGSTIEMVIQRDVTVDGNRIRRARFQRMYEVE